MSRLGIGFIGTAKRRRKTTSEGSPPVVAKPFRIVPVSEYKTFVIAPHEWGAIAYEMIWQNGGSTTIPGSSIGAPYGGWRWYGTHHLLTVESDPSSPISTLHQDIGSVDSAIQGNFGFDRFGGHYHGGMVINSSKMPDLSTERYVSSFNFGYDATITWEDAETATVSYDMSIQPDGNLAGSISYTSDQAFYGVYLSMMIGNNFTHFSDDGGVTWQDGTSTANYPVAAGPIILRQPSTGYEIEIGTDQTGIPTAGLTNSVVNNGNNRLKAYVYKSTQGQPLGTLAMSRTIEFRKTSPDPVPTFEPLTINFEGETGTAPTGWSRVMTPSGTQTSVLEDDLWKLEGGAAPAGNQRHVLPLPTLVKDGTTVYHCEIDYTSLTNQTSLTVMVNKDGIGSNSSANNLALDGGNTAYQEYLGAASASTASFTFKVPEGTVAPHLLFDGVSVANRGVHLSEIRIDQSPYLNPNPYGYGVASNNPPTGWTVTSAPSGITRTITQGSNYVDIRFNGTTVGSGSLNITTNGMTDTSANLGETMEAVYDMEIIDTAGLSTLTNVKLRLYEMDGSGSGLASGSTAVTPNTTRQAYTFQRTLNQTGVGRVRSRLEFDYPAATPLDLTFRIYAAGMRKIA